MLHKAMKSIVFSSIVFFAVGAGLPSLAQAETSDGNAATPANSELEVTFEEFENEVVVHIRDASGALSKPDVVTSRRGYMLSFPGETVDTSFHRMNAWRLGRLQTQQYGTRAVVRLEQRRYRPSPIEDNVKIIRVLGGMDIVIEENKVMPKLEPEATSLADLPTVDAAAPTTAAPDADADAPVVQNSPMDETATPAAAATIAALQRKLGGEVPVDPGQIPTGAILDATAAPLAANDAPGADADALAVYANVGDAVRARRYGGGTFQRDFNDGIINLAAVGAFKPNLFGLHDVHGNVFEWCLDGFHGYAEREPRPRDGLRGAPGGARFRIYRGGSFYRNARYARTTLRTKLVSIFADSDVGLRTARRITP